MGLNKSTMLILNLSSQQDCKESRILITNLFFNQIGTFLCAIPLIKYQKDLIKRSAYLAAVVCKELIWIGYAIIKTLI